MRAHYSRKLRHSSDRGDIFQFVCLIEKISYNPHAMQCFEKWNQEQYTTGTYNINSQLLYFTNNSTNWKSWTFQKLICHPPPSGGVNIRSAGHQLSAGYAGVGPSPPRASSDPILRTIPSLHARDPIPLRVNLNPWVGPVSLGNQPIVVCLSALQDPSVS